MTAMTRKAPAIAALVITLGLGVGRVAHGHDVLQVYEDALRFDTQLHAAYVTRLANRDARSQALA